MKTVNVLGKNEADNKRSIVRFPILLKLFFVFFILGILPFVVSSLFLIAGYESFVFGLFDAPLKDIPGLDQHNIEEGLQQIRLRASLIIFIFLVLATIGSVVLARLFTKPLQRLLHGLEQVSEGNLSAYVPVTTRDESGQISQKFNEMILRLREIRERERAISRSKSEFITIAAHRLRTPTSAVKWSLKMVMESGRLSHEQEELLKKGYGANERMITLISDLLDVARIEEGRFGYNFRKVDIHSVIKKVAGEFALMSDKKKIDFELIFPQKPIPKVYIDPERIEIVLANLLSNAFDYTNRGGRVVIGVRAQKNTLEVYVKDTGIGIPRAQMKHLFTKFFRGAEAARMQTEGTGLGLYIAKNIILRHGGKVWVRSKKGEGSTLFFTLRFQKSDIPEHKELFKGLMEGI